MATNQSARMRQTTPGLDFNYKRLSMGSGPLGAGSVGKSRRGMESSFAVLEGTVAN
jgi:hypothetical protein